MSPRRRALSPIYLPALAFLLAAPALAQAPVEQIEVTAASTTPDRSSDAPKTIISAAEIARSGAASLDDLLEQIPALGSQGVNGNQNAGGYGEAFADLRNLNFDRTLVLIDGRRMVSSGIRTDEAVDLNSIPLALVDHIEILRDGSQPLYGADAVAGVVNVVLKKSVEGVKLEGYGGIAGAGDDATSSFTLTGGHATDRLHYAFSLGVFDKRPVPQADRSWAAGPITEAVYQGSSVKTLTGGAATPGGQAIGSGIDELALGGGRFRPFNPNTDQYDFAGTQYLQGSLDRATGSFNVDLDVSDSVTGFLQTLGTLRRATNTAPPATLGLSGTAKNPDGFVIPADNPFNPFGEPIDLARSVTEAGPLATTTTGDVFRAVAGLQGRWNEAGWSVSLDHGESRNAYATANEINLTKALQSVTSGMVDWFGPDSLPPQILRGLTYTDRARSLYDETVLQADFHAPLFGLPGGQARVQAGLEARWESGSTSVDPVTLAGDQAGPDAAPTKGGYATREAYLDLTLPLLADRPWVKMLSASLSARETSTDRYGDYPSFRATLSYAPNDTLRLRGGFGMSHRPPAISEAFGGVTADFLPVTDPCDAVGGLRANPVVARNCGRLGLGANFAQTSPLIDVPSGGNASLHPEVSTNQTFGAVFTPPAWPEASLALDWWRYRIANAIDSLADTDPNLIPDACFQSVNLSSPFCGLITRVQGGPEAGQISEILARDENVGVIRTSGIDLDLQASRALGTLGKLHLDGQATWLLDYEIKQTGQASFTQYAGTFPGLVGVGLYARLRGRLETTLDHGPWSLSWTARCMSGGRVLGGEGPYTHAPAILYQDFSLSRALGPLTLMMGVNNLANVAPPRLLDGITNTDTNSYDVVGLFAWTRLIAVF